MARRRRHRAVELGPLSRRGAWPPLRHPAPWLVAHCRRFRVGAAAALCDSGGRTGGGNRTPRGTLAGRGDRPAGRLARGRLSVPDLVRAGGAELHAADAVRVPGLAGAAPPERGGDAPRAVRLHRRGLGGAALEPLVFDAWADSCPLVARDPRATVAASGAGGGGWGAAAGADLALGRSGAAGVGLAAAPTGTGGGGGGDAAAWRGRLPRRGDSLRRGQLLGRLHARPLAARAAREPGPGHRPAVRSPARSSGGWCSAP